MILRRLARPMLASIFVWGGVQGLRHPQPHAEAARGLVDKTVGQERLPDSIPTDPNLLAKVDGAVKLGAGLTLAVGKAPRLSALLLAGTLVPTTVAGHAFWEYQDEEERAGQLIHFLKNVGLLGGLLIASADTEGKPSVSWRAKRAAKSANRRAHSMAESAKVSAIEARQSAAGVAGKIRR